MGYWDTKTKAAEETARKQAATTARNQINSARRAAAKTLRDAASEMERRGLANGKLMAGDGSVCVAGALGLALGMTPRQLMAAGGSVPSTIRNTDTWKALDEILKRQGNTVTSFSDDHFRNGGLHSRVLTQQCVTKLRRLADQI